MASLDFATKSPAIGGDIAVSQELAEFAANLTWSRIPETVRDTARLALVNILGTMIAGSHDESISKLLNGLKPFMGAPRATMVGRAAGVDVLGAAFLNAASGNALDFDDTDPQTLIHPGAAMFGALLSVAEDRRLSGADVLTAFVVGTEIAFRLGRALGPRHYARGWHITVTCGTVGAAAAVGNLIGLDAEQMRNAIGISATQSSGIIENLGAEAKSVGVGGAARNGINAAYWAQAGVAAAPAPLEGKGGFFHVFSPDANPHLAVQGLGKQWAVLNNRVKPYPCCLLMQPLVDAALELRAREPLDPERIKRVIVRAHPLQIARNDRPHPATGREAKVSIQYTLPVALIRGTVSVPDYLESAVADPQVAELGRRVVVVEDRNVAPDWGCCQIEMIDGRLLDSLVKVGRGNLGRPLDAAEVGEKVIRLIEWAAPSLDAPHLLDALWSFDTADDIPRILAQTIPA